MEFLWAIIIGFIAGLVARALMPGKDPGGFIITTLLGIGGALVATFLGRALGFYREGGVRTIRLVTSYNTDPAAVDALVNAAKQLAAGAPVTMTA